MKKFSVCFDDELARDVDRYFAEPKPELELDDSEPFDMVELDMPATRHVATVLPRRASYDERMFEWRANRNGWIL